jgi:curved DNA-binding protein
MTTAFRDYYQTLGVSREASQKEIQQAYRRLARKYHPDTSKEPEAEKRFKEINEAHEVLKDAEKRKQYDTLGANWKAGQEFTPPPGWEHMFGGRSSATRGSASGFGFSDFFETLFGGGRVRSDGGGFGGFGSFQSGRSGGWGSPARGQDYETEITITLAEAHSGVRRSIELRRPTSGTGHALRHCDVRIPEGTRDGDRLRLSGQGGDAGGGPAGDLFLRVRVAPHATLRVDGNDLRTDVHVAPWEAALGAKVPVHALDGSIDLKIPPGTPSGRTLRLRGQGLHRRGGGRGDLLATLMITVPPSLTAEEKELFEKLAQVSQFQPRAR